MLSTKVKKIVQHAYQTVPFYMNKAGGKSVNLDEWLELPITQKNDLVQKNDSFISANYLADMLQNKLLHAHTSGTTGKCADIFWSMSECKRSLLPSRTIEIFLLGL